MLKYEERDATEITNGIIAHGVNCQRKMASGIAKTIREKWPKVYQAYMRAPSGEDMLGSAHIICIEDSTLYVSNIYSQVYYGYGGKRYADPKAIFNGMSQTVNFAAIYDLPVYLPRIGCGLGGLEWSEVEEGLVWLADNYPSIDIIVCDLPTTEKETPNEFVTY